MWILAPKGFDDDGVSKWRQGKARSFLRPRSTVRRFSMGAEEVKEELAGQRHWRRMRQPQRDPSARPSVSAPPLFPRTIYIIMYEHDVPPLRPVDPGPDTPISRQTVSHVTTIVHYHPELRPTTFHPRLHSHFVTLFAKLVANFRSVPFVYCRGSCQSSRIYYI